ncbi:hypothetical protein CMO88_03270 [Candidatus Woesearchaeota archaeon]|nr:hypothetical protein [Candidatus Woesearchaeota archaeon]|tara:strand:- start:5545 stop:6027 length:483 start_codon:yes stop_codon:yes gene_type:complete
MHEMSWKDVYLFTSDDSTLAKFLFPKLFQATSIQEMKNYCSIRNRRELFMLDVTVAGNGDNITLVDKTSDIEAYVNRRDTIDEKTFEAAKELSIGRNLTVIGMYGSGEKALYLPIRINGALAALPFNRVVAERGKLNILYVLPEEIKETTGESLPFPVMI